jgi:hypothetical protein
MGAAFACDFTRFEREIRAFLEEGPDTLIALRAIGSEPRSVHQLGFLVSTYAASFPLIEPPESGWGNNHPYECARFIAGCITSLGEHLSEDSQLELERLVAEDRLKNHADHARHVLAEHTRAMAEAAWSTHTLPDVRHVLLAGPPQNIEDLQGLLMDELEALQHRLRDGTFNSVLPFWDGDKPGIENYCRDRLAEHLEPYLARFNVRVHSEGAMPDHNRCDLLSTIGNIDLPIEIKGQWHSNVWNGACAQLEDNYSRNYRSQGRGIYLVLWFGDVPGFNPPGIRKHGKPEDASGMLEAIRQRSPKNISERTKLMVLDVSKPRLDR